MVPLPSGDIVVFGVNVTLNAFVATVVPRTLELELKET